MRSRTIHPDRVHRARQMREGVCVEHLSIVAVTRRTPQGEPGGRIGQQRVARRPNTILTGDGVLLVVRRLTLSMDQPIRILYSVGWRSSAYLRRANKLAPYRA
jgi:hypothetical protein